MKISYATENIRMPLQRAHDTDSGFDVFTPEAFSLEPGESKTISTGYRIRIPDPIGLKILRFVTRLPLYIEAQVRPKSGRSKADLEVSLGTIDNGYTGVFGVTIRNLRRKTWTFNRDEKIAQIVFCLVLSGKKLSLVCIPMERLLKDKTHRGDGGFGSTGVVSEIRPPDPKPVPRNVVSRLESPLKSRTERKFDPDRPLRQLTETLTETKAMQTISVREEDRKRLLRGTKK